VRYPTSSNCRTQLELTVFQRSQLKKAIGNYSAEANFPEGFEVELQELEEPEEVQASRTVLKTGQVIKQWLIKCNAEDTTWEDEAVLISKFPRISLVDKAVEE